MQKLKEIREANGITQQKLADKMGVSRSAIAMWETGASQPDNNILLLLAEFFNCSTDYLLGKKGGFAENLKFLRKQKT